MFEHHERYRPLLAVLVSAPLLMSAPVIAQTIYRHVDENGAVTFSDVEMAGAEEMTLEVSAPPANAFDEQQAMIEQQLAVAKVLEDSRLAREDARIRRLEAQANAQPKTVYYREEDRRRYVGGRWGWGWPGYPGHPGKPVHPIEPPPQLPETRPVPLPPLHGG